MNINDQKNDEILSESFKSGFFIPIVVLGISGMVSQIVLIRELMVTYFGNELSIGIILANWLILEALGSLILGSRIEHYKRKIEAFIVVVLIFSVSLPLTIFFSRTLKNIIGLTFGEGLGLIPMIFSSFLILLPVSATHGALFTFGCKIFSIYSKQGYSEQGAAAIGKVYIYEIIGSACGGVLLTYLLLPYFHSFQIAFMILFLNSITCIYLLIFTEQKVLFTKVLGLFTVIFIILSALLTLGKVSSSIHWKSIKIQWKNQEVIFYVNSYYGNITVTKSKEQYNIFSDGIPVITVPTPDTLFIENFVHLPMLIHPCPEEVLVISGGAGGVISELLKHPVQSIDYVELDPLIFTVLEKFPTEITKKELNNPRVNIIHVDGRRFLKKTVHTYDVIFIGLSNPSDLQTNRLFTEEFFSLAKERLNQDGIFMVTIPGSLSYLNEEQKKLNVCIINTLKKVYPKVSVIPGDTNFFIVSDNPEGAKINPSKLKQRLLNRNLKVSLITPFYIDYRLDRRWTTWFSDTIRDTEAKINRDFLPSAVFYSLNLWNAIFSPKMRGLFKALGSLNIKIFSIICACLIPLFLLGHILWKEKISKIAVPLSIATTGFAGMMFDLVLIFSFQVLYGYVYYLIGLLITAFMAGSGIGSISITSNLERIKRNMALFICFEIGVIAFSGLLPVSFLMIIPGLDQKAILPFAEIIFFSLCFIGGFLVGLEFPLANKIHLKKSPAIGKTAGLLYASDLLGGFIGGILGGVVLLPVLGLTHSCFVIIIFKLTSLFVLVISSKHLTPSFH